MKERVLVESKIKEKTLLRLEITKQLLGLWVTSQISQLKTYQNKKAKVLIIAMKILLEANIV
jgi:uncharacterized membrane protein YsdA (DUF1294 family)